jgi:amino acid transporter
MPRPSPVSGESALVRAIGVRGLAAAVVNSTIGAGIFVLPATVAASLGPASPVAYLTCAAVMTLVIATFAVAGSRVSLTGGLYAYVEVAFGPFVGFLAGVLQWLALVLSVATVASALAASVALVVPVAATMAGKGAFLALVFGALASINVRGVVLGTRVVEAMTLAKLLPLAALVAAGVWFVEPQHVMPALAPASDIGTTSLTLIFAFLGVEVALVPSGEVRDPARTVPRALFLALGLVTLVYLAIQFVAQGVLGPTLGTYRDAPLAETAARVMGPWGRALMLAGGAVSMLGYTSSDMLSTPRTLFAFGRDGFLPAALARVHPRHRTPQVAIVAHAVVVWAISTAGTFAHLVVVANVTLLSLYTLCAAAAWELVRRDVRAGGVPFRVPGGRAVPVATIVVLVWLLSHATRQEFGLLGLVVSIAAVLYLIRRAGTRRPAAGESMP